VKYFLDLSPSVKERTLKAFLDLYILRLLADQPMSAYQINKLIVKKFGILIAPNTIYAKLSTMERQGWIKRTRNGNSKTHNLTEQGQQIISNLPALTEEIHQTIKALLKT
jgi:DNA-binding PadR family transcriptional regulator